MNPIRNRNAELPHPLGRLDCGLRRNDEGLASVPSGRQWQRLKHVRGTCNLSPPKDLRKTAHHSRERGNPEERQSNWFPSP